MNPGDQSTDPSAVTGSDIAVPVGYVTGDHMLEICRDANDSVTGYKGRKLNRMNDLSELRETFGIDRSREVERLYARLRIGYLPKVIIEAPALPVDLLPEALRPTRDAVLERCAATRQLDPEAYIAAREQSSAAEYADEVAEEARANSVLPPMFDFERDWPLLEPPEMLVPNLIQTGTVVQVVAKPNEGKTFAVLSWACDLARRGKPVVYIVGDDGMFPFTCRVLAWCDAHGAASREVFANLHLFTDAVQFANDKSMAALEGVVIQLGAALVVFDTQHRCSEGIQENSNDDSRILDTATKRLISHGPSVVLIHHTSDGSTGRGAKSVDGFIATRLNVSDVKKDGTRHLKIEQGKQKNMAKGAAVYYPFERVEIPGLAEKYGGTIPAGIDPFTMVMRLPDDPFETAVGDPLRVKENVLLYVVLDALRSSTKALPIYRVTKYAREAGRPLLVARGLMADGTKKMPKGFSEQEITELLKGLGPEDADNGKAERAVGGPALVDDTASTDRTAYYTLTSKGEDELSEIAKSLGISPEKPENVS